MNPKQQAAVIAVIRTLGFVGNTHYCPGCLNRFHEDRGQHQPGCPVLAESHELGDTDLWDQVEAMLA